MREHLDALLAALRDMSLDDQVVALNTIRTEIHRAGPFASEPVDCVVWLPSGRVVANDYNPNSVAPPEMQLLATSIRADGYTQPIVVYPIGEGERLEVVDGFHRHRVGKEVADVTARVHGYLPVVPIKETRTAKADRMASTIRHNRARGKHAVDKMSEIVVDLARRKWTDEKIAHELGMEPDEVLRLKQISGLASAFADRSFSEAWTVAERDEEAG